MKKIPFIFVIVLATATLLLTVYSFGQFFLALIEHPIVVMGRLLFFVVAVLAIPLSLMVFFWAMRVAGLSRALCFIGVQTGRGVVQSDLCKVCGKCG